MIIGVTTIPMMTRIVARSPRMIRTKISLFATARLAIELIVLLLRLTLAFVSRSYFEMGGGEEGSRRRRRRRRQCLEEISQYRWNCIPIPPYSFSRSFDCFSLFPQISQDRNADFLSLVRDLQASADVLPTSFQATS